MNKEKKIILFFSSIIVFFIILFFLIRHFGIIDVKIPTGNVDIFDINFIDKDGNSYGDCGCYCHRPQECICDCHKTKGHPYYDNVNQIAGTNVNIASKPEEGKNEVVIYDEQVEYSQETTLNIFAHKSYYVKNDKIAPGVQNSYQFVIRNNNNFAIRYNFKMQENNPYGINMKYRLKLNGTYILGNDEKWVTASDLIETAQVLADKSYNVYTLDWKWFEGDDEKDTQIGKNMEANYQLGIEFFADRY